VLTRSLLTASLLALCAAAPAVSQDAAPDPFQTARFRFGAVAFSPGVSVTNLGWDSNVFNEWDNPKDDFTGTLTPQTDLWLRFGPARLVAHGAIGYTYFAHYVEERAWHTDDSVRVEVPLIHFRPYMGYSYLNVRERPGYEIDQRVRRIENRMFAGADFPLTRKTTIGAAFKRTKTDYPESETFNEIRLRFLLNRWTDVYTVSGRYALTPLTTILLDTEYVREKFEFDAVRNSAGFRLLPGVEFKPLALISGSARVGYRRMNFDSPTVPDYGGVVATVNLGYTLLGATRFGVQVDRDIQFSYEQREPYYILTGVTATITRRLTNAWDLQARAARQSLAYHQAVLIGSDGQGPDVSGGGAARTDYVVFYGGGVGYRIGTDVRLGFNVDYYTRRSAFEVNQYKGLRVGSAVTYGF
jgi:hypothetical protein